MKIGIDLDDVLLDFNSAFLVFHNAKYGTNAKREDMKSFFIEEVWEMTHEEAHRRIDEFYKTPEHENAVPIAGAVEAIDILKKDHELYLVTAKPSWLKGNVDAWVAAYFPSAFKETVFTRMTLLDKSARKKSEICKELGIEAFVDDSMHNAKDIGESGIPVFLIDAPWNQGALPRNVKRVKGWGEIVDEIQKTAQ